MVVIPIASFVKDNELASGTSTRLKMWTVGAGKKERERVKALEAASRAGVPVNRRMLDEIAQERGVRLLPEGKGKYYHNDLAELNF